MHDIGVTLRSSTLRRTKVRLTPRDLQALISNIFPNRLTLRWPYYPAYPLWAELKQGCLIPVWISLLASDAIADRWWTCYRRPSGRRGSLLYIERL